MWISRTANNNEDLTNNHSGLSNESVDLVWGCNDANKKWGMSKDTEIFRRKTQCLSSASMSHIIHTGFSINGGTPNWIVYNDKSYKHE